LELGIADGMTGARLYSLSRTQQYGAQAVHAASDYTSMKAPAECH